MSIEHQKVRHLLVIEDQDKKVVSLEASTYSIGRDFSNSIVLRSKWISRQHALLLRVTVPKTNDYAFRIIDGDLQGKRSTNGLFVNGSRCVSHNLKHGDAIVFGKESKATYHLLTNLSDAEFLELCSSGEISAFSEKSDDENSTIISAAAAGSESVSETALVRLASFPELIPNPIFETDLAGNLTYLNPAAMQQFPDLQAQKAEHSLIQDLIQNRENLRKKYFVREIKINHKFFEQFVHYIHESDLIRSYIVDITEKKRTEFELRRSEAKNRALLNAIPDLMIHLDLNGTILDFKPAKDFTLIRPQETVIERNLHEVLPTQITQQMMHHLKQALQTSETQVFEFEFLQKEDQIFHYEVRIVASADNEALAIIRNITERKFFEKQLLHDALHDSLTGLPNRHLFLNRLAHVIELSKRRENYLFAVLFVDLDRFKVINDSLGHSIGDQLLINISRRLEICLRGGDTVARLGGDEFAILLEDLNSISDATVIAERLLREISLPLMLEEREVFTTASIGIASGLLKYERPEEMLRDADTAMYHAKSLGKARYEVFDRAMHARVVALLQLDNDLRRAVERQEFQLMYQPIVSLKTGRLAGFETLIRWQHPQRGLVLPGEFIQLAEETGLIIPLGEWILYEACHQAHLWHLNFPKDEPLTVSVNLSSKQFTQRDLVDQIRQILHRTSLPAECLKLEITESVIMENTKDLKDTLLALKSLDIQLCIDDFGTGYSSLSYLHRFPIDTLKIDRSFINTIDTASDDSRYTITQTIVVLAHNLGLSVVAEGVETEAQLQLLKTLECEYAQGYFFSKPLESSVAEKLIISNPQW